MAVNDTSRIVGGLTAIIKKYRIVALHDHEGRAGFFNNSVPANTLPDMTMERSGGGETFTHISRIPVLPEPPGLCFSSTVDIEEIFESAVGGYIRYLKPINNRVEMNAID